MAGDGEREVPDGAAVFPLIPAELGVDPLLLGVVHAAVFLSGSDESVVHPDAAEEALHYVAAYLQRLAGAKLARVREDVDVLVAYGRQEGWPKQLIRAIKELLTDFGVGEEGES